MTTECPKIVGSHVIITKHGELLPVSKEDTARFVGAKINVRCEDGYVLNGGNQVTCLEGGKWDKAAPTCDLPKPADEAEVNTIIIAVCSAVSALVLLSLVAIMIIYCYKKRQLDRKKLASDADSISDLHSLPGKHWDDDAYPRKPPPKYSHRTSSIAEHSERSFHSGVPTRWRTDYSTSRSPYEARTLPYEPRYRDYEHSDAYRSFSRSDYNRERSSYGSKGHRGRSSRPDRQGDRWSEHAYPNPAYAPWGRSFDDRDMEMDSLTSLPRAHAGVHNSARSGRTYSDYQQRY